MKKSLIWQILLGLGICPFVLPFAAFLYELLNASSWTLTDWLILYSFVYWPTYLIGLVLIGVSAYKLQK